MDVLFQKHRSPFSIACCASIAAMSVIDPFVYHNPLLSPSRTFDILDNNFLSRLNLGTILFLAHVLGMDALVYLALNSLSYRNH
jgi:hypothetical protein